MSDGLRRKRQPQRPAAPRRGSPCTAVSSRASSVPAGSARLVGHGCRRRPARRTGAAACAPSNPQHGFEKATGDRLCFREALSPRAAPRAAQPAPHRRGSPARPPLPARTRSSRPTRSPRRTCAISARRRPACAASSSISLFRPVAALSAAANTSSGAGRGRPAGMRTALSVPVGLVPGNTLERSGHAPRLLRLGRGRRPCDELCGRHSPRAGGGDVDGEIVQVVATEPKGTGGAATGP